MKTFSLTGIDTTFARRRSLGAGLVRQLRHGAVVIHNRFIDS